MNDKSRNRKAGLGRVLGYVGTAIGGFALAILLVANPLRLHPVDRWMHHILGHREYRATAETESAETGQLWTCGMHPQVIEDHPGTCPICGMKLVPVRGGQAQPGAAPSSSAGGEREILFYRNPMDPTVTSPVPMKDSMGMDYVPVYADDAASGEGSVVKIDPAVVQNMGVTTERVSRGDVKRQIRTVGYLDYDQEKMVSVTTKYQGFVENVYVNYIGQPVEQGAPLFDIYSPELVQTEQELLSAAEFARRMSDAPDDDARRRARALVDAARKRLAYWDITADQVKRLEETGTVFRTLAVTAPVGGLVMKRMDGLEGMAVRPGMDVIHLADLSTLWLKVEVYEDQFAWIHIGSPATISLAYFPGETFKGLVHFIEPEVSEKTRTITLTLRVPNPDRRLRAGMYATVLFEPVTAGNAVVVPSRAVLRTGERSIVVVALGGGRFVPRDVKLGPEGDGWVQVLSGVDAGETIVTSSQFLIDSESNLQEAIERMVAARTGKNQ